MKRFFIYIILIPFCALSCKKEEATPAPAPEKEYVTLSQMLEKSESTSKEFDVYIRDMIVTAVYEKYAQLEDETAGAQLMTNDKTKLNVGDKINGRISGKMKNSSGALSFLSLDVTSSEITKEETLPEIELQLSEVIKNKARYYNRRLKLKNITFVNGFKGLANGSGIFSQKGVQINAICRPAGITIEDGAQGDIVCYMTESVCYVYSEDAFTPHEIQTPFASESVCGVYRISGDVVSPLKVYTKYKDQYAYGTKILNTNSSCYFFRFQNYSAEWSVNFLFPLILKNGQQITLDIENTGTTGIGSGEKTVFVEKKSSDQVWLMDYSTNLGYIVKIEKEAQ